VLEEMSGWLARPLDRVYPVVFIDAIHGKVRDGQVANRAFYTAIGVTVDGKRDILGIWASPGGEGAKFWLGCSPSCATAASPMRASCVRRAQRPARRHHRHPAPRRGADPRAAPDPGHVPARRPPALGRHGPRPAPPLHGPHRTGGQRTPRRFLRRLVRPLPGGAEPVGGSLGRLRAVPGLQPRDPPGDLLDGYQRHRPTPSRACTPGSGEPPGPGATSPTSRPPSSASTLSCAPWTPPAWERTAG
jgi:hypothetical protein